MRAFEDCKQKVIDCTLLAFPDEEADIRLVTDASNQSMGGALEQCEVVEREGSMLGVLRPLGFFSRKFNNAQSKYSTYDRELMAISESVKHFYYFLEGRSFQICTDHKPIIFSQTKNHDVAPAHRIRRTTFLSEYNITYSYLPGRDNAVADALSRICALTLSADPAWRDKMNSKIACDHLPGRDNAVANALFQIGAVSLSIDPAWKDVLDDNIDCDYSPGRDGAIAGAISQICTATVPVDPAWRDRVDSNVASIRFPTIFSVPELYRHQLDDPELQEIL